MMALRFAVLILIPVHPVWGQKISHDHYNVLHKCSLGLMTQYDVTYGHRAKTHEGCAVPCAGAVNCSVVSVREIGENLYNCDLVHNLPNISCSNIILDENIQLIKQIHVTYWHRKMCQDIAQNEQNTTTGPYYVFPEDGQEAMRVYCDQDTAGGGWTLVYSYGYLDYDAANETTRISVAPTWPAPDVEPGLRSSATPRSPDEDGALEFSRWVEFGLEFLVATKMTNWYKCQPDGGSVAEYKDGRILCSVVKVLYPECGTVAPSYLSLFGTVGPILFYTPPPTNWPVMIWYDSSRTQIHPSHDPCGTNGFTVPPNNEEPRGAIYLRELQG